MEQTIVQLSAPSCQRPEDDLWASYADSTTRAVLPSNGFLNQKIVKDAPNKKKKKKFLRQV